MSQEESNIRKFSLISKTAPKAEQPGNMGDPCPICFGSGLEIVPGEGARLCQCRVTRAKENSLDRLNIPKRYAECHFHNYKPKTDSQITALNVATKLSLEFPVIDRGLLFMGEIGVGKTHLAISILKSLSEKGFYGYFCEFGALLKEIQNSYNSISRTTELQVLAPVFESDVLVLDELGASKPTDWLRDTLGFIINTRYNDKKLTIFTTNYLDEHRDKNDLDDTLGVRIGERLRSRIHEMSRTIRMDGEDYRKRFDRGASQKKSTSSNNR